MLPLSLQRVDPAPSARLSPSPTPMRPRALGGSTNHSNRTEALAADLVDVMDITEAMCVDGGGNTFHTCHGMPHACTRVCAACVARYGRTRLPDQLMCDALYAATGSKHVSRGAMVEGIKSLAMWSRPQDAQLVAFAAARCAAAASGDDESKDAVAAAAITSPLGLNPSSISLETEHEKLT